MSETRAPSRPSLRRHIFSLRTLVSFAIAIGFVAILAATFRIDWSKTWDNVQALDFRLYVAAIAVYYLTFIVRGLRWKILANNAGLGDSPLRQSAVGALLRSTHPGRLVRERDRAAAPGRRLPRVRALRQVGRRLFVEPRHDTRGAVRGHDLGAGAGRSRRSLVLGGQRHRGHRLCGHSRDADGRRARDPAAADARVRRPRGAIPSGKTPGRVPPLSAGDARQPESPAPSVRHSFSAWSDGSSKLAASSSSSRRWT